MCALKEIVRIHSHTRMKICSVLCAGGLLAGLPDTPAQERRRSQPLGRTWCDKDGPAASDGAAARRRKYLRQPRSLIAKG